MGALGFYSPLRPRSSDITSPQDTAGQERFSSLSSAFFRGADAVILMFDVNQLQSLDALTKWWSEFKDKAPVLDEEADKFCCVFVGNKTDIIPANVDSRVSEEKAHQFIDELIPPGPISEPPTPDIDHPPTLDTTEIPDLPLNGDINHSPSEPTLGIDICHNPNFHSRGRKSAISRSRSRSTVFRGGTVGTMTTTRTVYHTPSSSVFDTFESACSSPIPTSAYSSRSPSHSPIRSPRRVASVSSTSSAPTITPSLFIRGQATTTCTTPAPIQPIPPPLERRPKLFFTSAKTGESVSEVFEYVARRVVVRWEYEEAIEARTLHIQDSSMDGPTIRLGHPHSDRLAWMKPTCCDV